MSDSSKAPVSSMDRITAMQKQLDSLHQDLARERQRVSRATRLSVLVGVAALILMSVYFYIGYTRFDEVTQPETVVDVAQLLIDDHLPEARAALEQQIVASAPSWAEGLSKQVQGSMPQAREKLTERFIDVAEKMTQEATIMSEDKYRTYLRANKPMLEAKFDELGKNPELAEKSLVELQVPLEAQFGSDMRLDGAALSKDISSVNANLKFLGAGKGLSAEQQVERRVWMLARRLQLEARIVVPEGLPKIGLADEPSKPALASSPAPKAERPKPPAEPKKEDTTKK